MKQADFTQPATVILLKAFPFTNLSNPHTYHKFIIFIFKTHIANQIQTIYPTHFPASYLVLHNITGEMALEVCFGKGVFIVVIIGSKYGSDRGG